MPELAAALRVLRTTFVLVKASDPLLIHYIFDTFGGLVTKLTWVFFGLMPTGMAASSAYIHSKRTKLAINSSGLLGFLNHLGNWKWPNIALVALVPMVTFFRW